MSRRIAVLALGVALALLRMPVAATAATGDPVLEAPAMPWPAPVTRTLANGLQVAVFPRHTWPIVQVQLTLDAGSAQEGTRPSGTAALVVAMIRSGTSSRPAEQFQSDLEALGGSLGASVTRDHAVVAAAFLAPQLGAGLELLSDAVVNPIFPDEELENARRIALTTLAPQRGTASGVADTYAWRAAFAPHSYARDARGSASGLLAVTREDLRALHRDRWRPDGACLVIAGDVEPERAFELAADWFGRWAGTAVPPDADEAPAPRFGRILLADAPGRVAEIRLVRPAPARGSPELPRWTTAVSLLQAPGRLPAGVRASLVNQREASLLIVSAQAPVDSAAARIRQIQDAFNRLASRPPAVGEVRAAREAYARALPQSIETLGGLAANWAAGHQSGLEDGHLARIAAAYADPALDATVAGVWPLLAKPWVMAVAGPAATLGPELSALAPVETIRTDAVAAPPAEAPPTAQERAQGRRLVDAAIAAHGGLAKLQAVQTLMTEGELELQSPIGDIVGEFSALRARPDRFFMSTKVLNTSLQQVLVGDRGWAAAPTGDSVVVRDLDSSGVAVARSFMESDAVSLLLGARAADPAARGTDRVGRQPADVVEYTSASGLRYRLLFDPATHRLAALDFARTDAGTWQERRQFSDYRAVSGIWIPFVEERMVAGERIGVTTTRRALVNAPADDRLFQYPKH